MEVVSCRSVSKEDHDVPVDSCINTPEDIAPRCSDQSLMSMTVNTRKQERSFQAKPFICKKKVPPPGSYPSNFSPYRLANFSSSNNAVRLTPAEILSDRKELYQATKSEFSSQYFAEKGSPESNQGCPHKGNRTHVNEPLFRVSDRVSLLRTSGRRALTSVQLPIPKTIQEERKQLRAALRASVKQESHVPLTIASPQAPNIDFATESPAKSFKRS